MPNGGNDTGEPSSGSQDIGEIRSWRTRWKRRIRRLWPKQPQKFRGKSLREWQRSFRRRFDKHRGSYLDTVNFDGLRHVGDRDADTLIASYLERFPTGSERRVALLQNMHALGKVLANRAELFQQRVEEAADRLDHNRLDLTSTNGANADVPIEFETPSIDPEWFDLDDAFVNWITRPIPAPRWLNREMVSKGQQFWHDHGLAIGFCLYLASLPSSYAVPRGAQVLRATEALLERIGHRIPETGQFLFDALAEDGLAVVDGHLVGPEVQAVQRIRLMHAFVRARLTTDDDGNQTPWTIVVGEKSGPAGPSDPSGSNGDGEIETAVETPINQEDLAGTLVAFFGVTLPGEQNLLRKPRPGPLQRLRVPTNPATTSAADYIHLWCVIGLLLGVEERLLPLGRGSHGWPAAIEPERVFADGVALKSTILNRHIPLTPPKTLGPQYESGVELARVLINHLRPGPMRRAKITRGMLIGMVGLVSPHSVPSVLGLHRRVPNWVSHSILWFIGIIVRLDRKGKLLSLAFGFEKVRGLSRTEQDATLLSLMRATRKQAEVSVKNAEVHAKAAVKAHATTEAKRIQATVKTDIETTSGAATLTEDAGGNG